MSDNHEPGRLPPDERREQILEVAAAHFARADFEAVSMQAIATDAGVTRALVYHYFSGKAALLDALLRREAQTLLAATEPDPALSAEQNIERALSAYLDHFLASRGQLRDLYFPGASAPPLVHELSRSNHAVHVERVLAQLALKKGRMERVAVQGWLGFVMEAARASANGPRISRAALIRLCMDVLCAVTGVPIAQKTGSVIASTRKVSKK